MSECRDLSYLVEVDHRLPEVTGLLVEVTHTDLTEVTGMVFIHVGTVVMLTTSETTTTGICISPSASSSIPQYFPARRPPSSSFLHLRQCASRGCS